MKNVIIRCISNNTIIDKYQVIIYNKYNKIVFNKHIENGLTELYLEKDVYKAYLIPLNICSFISLISFIVIDDINHFDFYLKGCDISPKITIILVDKTYDKLPIERGEIKLWQDHIL